MAATEATSPSPATMKYRLWYLFCWCVTWKSQLTRDGSIKATEKFVKVAVVVLYQSSVSAPNEISDSLLLDVFLGQQN